MAIKKMFRNFIREKESAKIEFQKNRIEKVARRYKDACYLFVLLTLLYVLLLDETSMKNGY